MHSKLRGLGNLICLRQRHLQLSKPNNLVRATRVMLLRSGLIWTKQGKLSLPHGNHGNRGEDRSTRCTSQSARDQLRHSLLFIWLNRLNKTMDLHDKTLFRISFKSAFIILYGVCQLFHQRSWHISTIQGELKDYIYGS